MFKQINSELSDRLARVQESQQRIEQIKTDIIKRAENYDALLQQLKIAVVCSSPTCHSSILPILTRLAFTAGASIRIRPGMHRHFA